MNIEATRAKLESDVHRASLALKVFPRGITGLTPDSVKATPEWKAAKNAYNVAFEILRQFNQSNKP